MRHLLLLVCFAALMVSVAGASMVPGGQVQPPWLDPYEWSALSDTGKIEARKLELEGRVNSYLALRGYRLGSGAGGEFRKAYNRAATEIQSMRPELQRVRTEQAIDNFRTMIDAMIIESRQIPGYRYSHFRVIGEQTLAGAMSKLCPLWPFC